MEKRKSTLEDQEKGVLYLYFTDWNSMDFWKPVYRGTRISLEIPFSIEPYFFNIRGAP